MMKRRSINVYGRMRQKSTTANTMAKIDEEEEEDKEIGCEMRPGGMLVQKRTLNFADSHSAPQLLLRISYGVVRFEIAINERATFGELKKLLTAETRLQPAEQILIFRGKDRENGEYLDISGVKDRSKIILMEDPLSKERRFIEIRRNARIHNALRAITDVSMEIDKLADQVCAMEKTVKKGTKVAEIQITTLIEMLMRQAMKLDNISLEATEVSAKKHIQGKRVQKCVECLDVLKIANERVIVTSTKWETFDSATLAPSWEVFD